MRPYIVDLLNSLFATGLFTYILPNGVMMMGLGITVGVLWTARLARRLGLEAEVVYGMSAWGAGAGLAGARVMSLFYAPELYRQSPISFFDPLAGDNAAYGGLIAGAAAIGYYLVRRKLEARRYLDCLGPAAGIGYCIARLGCFLDGDDFGSVTDGLLAVRFPQQSPAHLSHIGMGLLHPASIESLPVHPVQLYSAVAGLIVAAAGALLSRRKAAAPGEAFALCWLIYACTRFGLEFLRGDEGRGFVGPLSTSQAISLPVALLSLLVLFYLRKRRSGTP